MRDIVLNLSEQTLKGVGLGINYRRRVQDINGSGTK